MRADLPEDILEEILNLKKDRTNITDLAALETRGKEEFDFALSQLKANGCVLEDDKGLYLTTYDLFLTESFLDITFCNVPMFLRQASLVLTLPIKEKLFCHSLR